MKSYFYENYVNYENYYENKNYYKSYENYEKLMELEIIKSYFWNLLLLELPFGKLFVPFPNATT